MTNMTEVYSSYKSVLFSLAYRMLGSVADAEDIVQEAFLNLNQVSLDSIHHVKSYLWKVTTNLSIDFLRSARKRREVYVGSWLPEPILNRKDADPADRVITNEELSIAFLLLLENLNPVERAVFLLREVYSFSYDEIAHLIGKSPDNCRKIQSRAKQKVGDLSPKVGGDRSKREETVRDFMEAVQSNNTEKLLSILSDDFTIYSDGGGKAKANLRPIFGIERAVAALRSFHHKIPSNLIFMEADVNGQPGMIMKVDDQIFYVMAFQFDEDKLSALYNIVNPDKLKHLKKLK
ncbi:RNA polymerase sigma-70 factor [Neobacillus piezotolerans]|uniref:RNA polymerase sigma-70 factor n=2 Tax=Neobacillus piezotolerans TaxID=2259171 RepID=A0A3D8GXR3_9BACI|nr:RNA polymerase sigma-70 factor [Neobacillus piezotolerans]